MPIRYTSTRIYPLETLHGHFLLVADCFSRGADLVWYTARCALASHEEKMLLSSVSNLFRKNMTTPLAGRDFFVSTPRAGTPYRSLLLTQGLKIFAMVRKYQSSSCTTPTGLLLPRFLENSLPRLSRISFTHSETLTAIDKNHERSP